MLKKEPIEIDIAGKKAYIHFLTIVGSTLHRLTIKESSDIDLKGVIVWGEKEKNSLEQPVNIIDKGKLKKEYGLEGKVIMKRIIMQLNDKLKLSLNPEEDDIVLYDARKFIIDSKNNDFNMLDMLCGDKKVFTTEVFNKILDNYDAFINYDFAKSKFTNMSVNNYKMLTKNGKGSRLYNKTQVKVIQLLFSIIEFIQNKKYTPILNENQRNFLMKIKRGEISEEIFEEVYRKNLDIADKLELPENTIDNNKLNELLIEVNMYNINTSSEKKEKNKKQKRENML